MRKSLIEQTVYSQKSNCTYASNTNLNTRAIGITAKDKHNERERGEEGNNVQNLPYAPVLP